MINRNKLIILSLIFMGFNLSSFAQQEVSKIKNLTKEADLILSGKITEKKSAWNESKSRIYTKAILHVDEQLKGKGNSTSVEISYLGGEIDGVGERYSHMPEFKENEEVLVFLKIDKMNNYKVLNGEEGKISIIRDKKTNQKMTTSNIPVNSLKDQIKSYLVK